MASEGFETRRASGTAKLSQQQTEDYRLDLFGRHIPRILVKQLIAKLVDQFIYQSYDNDLDQIGAFSCTPSIGRFDAALLFVDISGFTVLSQRLPVDELRLCINNYFKIILDTIIRHGGDVVKFAGDALFVIWPVDEDKPYIPVDLSADIHHSHKHEPDETEKLHRMQYAVARAVNCGIEINRLCSNYRVDLKKKIVNDIEVPISRLLLDQDSLASSSLPTDTPSPVQSNEEDFTYLNVHSGCACGTLAGIDVGAADRWEYVMIGDPLRDVADAESAAEKGEIVLSAFIHNVMCGNTYLHPEREDITEEELKARSATLDLSTSGDTLLPCGCSRTANGCFRLNQEKSMVIPDAPQVSEEDEDHEQADLELAYYRQVMEYAKRAFEIGKPVIMKRFIEYLKNENNKESNSYNESEPKKTLLSTSSSLPNLPPASSVSAVTTNASPSTTPTSSSSISPQLEQFVYDFYIKWLLNCLTADFARHVHEADRIDFSIAKMNRLNCLESCAKEYKVAVSQGMFSGWRPPAIELENMMKNRETSESFVRKIRNLVGRTSSTTSSISTHSTGAISSTTASISVNTTSTASNNNNYLREKNQKKHERLLKKDRELNGELRNVIVMFIAIKSETKSITLDPDDDDDFKLTECAFTAFNFIPRSKSERDADTKLKKHYQTCMSLIVTSLKEKGGQLRQFIVDDKGTVAIGSFGLRGSTTYDNAASAVEAALDIIVHLQNVGLNASIGITSGKAYCGVVGSVRRHEYAVMGPSVNLSARLMGKAKSGEIICDISTRSVDRVHSYRNVGEVKAKGYTNLVSIFKPVFNRGSVMMTFGDRASFQHIENVPSQTPRRQGSDDEINGTNNNNNPNNLVPNSKQGSKQMGHIKRIIGRDSEEFDIINTLLNDVIDMNACSKPTEADIEQLVQEIQQGTRVSDNYISDSLLNTSCQSRMIVVHGPSGIGKSALINVVNDKLMRYSKKATWNLQIVNGKSSSLTVSDPFKPWQAVIRSILSQLSRYENIVHERREPELDLSDRTLVVKKWIKGLHYLSSYLSDEEKNWFPLLSAARIVPNIPDNDVTSKLSGQQKLELVIQLLTSIIRQYPILSNKVLLIILDDSHFMDAHSWKLVNVVLQSMKGVIFLASYYDAKENGPSLLSGDEEAQIESKSTTADLPSSTTISNDANSIIHTAILNLSSCRRISLTGLSSSSIRDMASHIFEGYNLSNLDDSIFHKLEEISGGNPLYIYEIGLACLEKLRSYAQDTNCDLNTIFDGGENGNKVFQHMLSEFRTNRIDEVIYYRFDRLDAQSQLILKMGSVITISNSHRGFNLEMLMHMLDRSISNASSPIIAGIENNTDALRASTSSGGNKELLCLFACLDLKDTGHKKYLKAAETLSKKLKEMVNQNSFIKIIRTRRRSSFNDSTKDEMMNEILNLQSSSFDFDLFDPNASFTTSAKKTQSMEEYEDRLRKEMIDICYDFNISLERKTIYDLMLDDQKESLHDRVANQLERENEEANSSNYLTFSDLNEEAFHWEKATVWGNAMSCYYRAGMLLDSLGALQECYKYLGNAYRMLILLRKDAKIKEQDYHSITFDVLLKEFEFLNNTLHPYDGDVKLSEDTIDKKLSLKTSLIAGKYSLTRIDIYNTFGGDSNLLEIAINLLLRFGQTSFTLGENPNITSRIYEDAIRLMLLTWPRKHDHKNDSRDFTDDVSNHYNLHNLYNNSNKRPQRPILINTQAKLAEIQEQVDSFKLQDPSICFPLIAGMASLYRTRRLADDEEHTKEKTLYQIMLNFAKTSPVYYRVHHLQAICLMNSLYNEYGNYEDALMCLIDIKSLYNYEQHSNALVKTYGNDRVPFTLTIISQYLLLLGYIPQAMVLREKLSNTWLPMMAHLHSMGTLALPLSAMNLLLCHVGEADRIFNHYRQTELSRPGAYSFFRDTNCMIDDYFQVKNLFLKEKYSELIGLFQQCDMMTSSSSPSSEQKHKEEIRPGNLQSCSNKEHHHNQQGHLVPMIQKIINKSYLIKENRPLLFDAILSFGLPVEYLCSDILVMLTESLTSTHSINHIYNPRDLLLLAIEYCDIAIDLTKIGHRHLFAYIVMVIAKLRIYLHLVKCPQQLEVDYQESKDGLMKHIQEILIIIRENDFIFVYLLILKVVEHYCTPKTNIFTANELINCLKAPSSRILVEGESIESISLQECIKRLQEYYLQQIISKNENFYSDNDENHVRFQSLFKSHFTSETLISTLHQDMNMIYEGVNKTYQQQ